MTRNRDGMLVNLSQLNRVAKKDENQEYQKPADKVEPKFHKGEWVVHKDGTVDQIEMPCLNVTTNKFGYDLVGGGYIGSEFVEDWHKWTIEDAKDGDVLSYRDGQWCFIYKGIVTEDTFKYYALLSEKGITVNDAAFSLLASCIIPATKEQRDQLEKAMADAGYTFDFEKKELRKIEQKHAEWSEEDEKMISNIRSIIEKYAFSQSAVDVNGDLCEKEYIDADNWLKSLRPQNKTYYWTENEIKFAISDYIRGAESYEKMVEKLRCLKPQNRWKPSEEQMKALKDALNDAIWQYDFKGSLIKEEVSRKHAETIESLYNDLKKLKKIKL